MVNKSKKFERVLCEKEPEEINMHMMVKWVV